MTKNQDSELTSFYKLLDQCGIYRPVLITNPTFDPAFVKFETIVFKITDLSRVQNELKTQKSFLKDITRNALGEFCLDLSSKEMSYTWNKGDMPNYVKVKASKTKLNRCSDNAFKATCTTIINFAMDNLDDLAGEGVTEDTITEVNKRMKAYETELANIAKSKVSLNTITGQINKAFAEARKYLKSIDVIVNSKSVSDPVMYADYWSAHFVRKAPASKVAVKGKLFDAENHQPIVGAMVDVQRITEGKSLTSGADLVKTVKVKSEGGGFNLKGLPTGTYQLTVTFAGYATQVTTFYVNEGYLTTVEVPLNKLA
jgi:hypothetical protein